MKAKIIILACILLCGCFPNEDKQSKKDEQNGNELIFKDLVSNVFYYGKEYIIYQEYSGDVIKWNRNSGQEIWRYKNRSKNPAIASLMKDGSIFFNEWGGDPIVGLNFKGEKVLDIKDDLLKDNIFLYSNVFIDSDEGIVVRGVNGVSGIDINSKQIVWKKKCFSASTKCVSYISSAGKDIIVAGLGDSLSLDHDNILSIDKKTGVHHWMYRIGGKFITEIAVNDSSIYIGAKLTSEKMGYNNTNVVFCFNKLNGNLLWKEKYEFTHSSNMVLEGDTLFFSDREDLYSVNARNGKLNWKKNYYPYIDILALHKGKLIVKQTDGIALLDYYNGNKSEEIKASINAGPWFFGDTICYSTNNHLFIKKLNF